MYISFLKYIKKRLGRYRNEQQALVDEEEHDLAVDGIQKLLVVDEEQQLPEEEVQPWEEAAKEARSEDDKKADDNKEPDDVDEEEYMTLEQIDFLSFLENLLPLVAALWTEVAQGQLPNWIATNLSGILLREADSLVEMTRLLDEESGKRKQWPERASRAPSPWATATISKDSGGLSKAQLTQDWVNAMDQTSEEGEGAPWFELTKDLSLGRVVEKFILPGMEVAPSTFKTQDRPYIATMLLGEDLAVCKALVGVEDSPLPLPARIPFVAIVGVYFCSLIPDDFAISAECDAACATIDENLAILWKVEQHSLFNIKLGR
ncbi:hypothetical protein FJTKL_06742 [Diaporthe vaccinii]|uniref:Uncharacterized protein n=1 Tax=Diaporthe vaccinii TaxID=105482 RepID=A0ABR4DQS8_9PEZI